MCSYRTPKINAPKSYLKYIYSDLSYIYPSTKQSGTFQKSTTVLEGAKFIRDFNSFIQILAIAKTNFIEFRVRFMCYFNMILLLLHEYT